MPLIECLAGGITTQVAGDNYTFQKDEHGRFVTNVENHEHAACLLNVPRHYRLAEKLMAATAEMQVELSNAPAQTPPYAPTQPVAPNGGGTQGGTGTTGQSGDGQNADEGQQSGDGQNGGQVGNQQGTDGQPDSTGGDEPEADDLTQINGIGEKTETALNAAGINSLEQIANWTDDDVKAIDAKLELHGAIGRGKWIEQAQELLTQPVEK